MAISDYLNESGVFVLYTPPVLHHRVRNNVRTCSLLPPREQEALRDFRKNHVTHLLLKCSLLPGDINGIRFLPTSNRLVFEDKVKKSVDAWKKLVKRFTAEWPKLTELAWEYVVGEAKMRYQRDPKREELTFEEYTHDLTTTFQTYAGSRPRHTEVEYTYVAITPHIISDVRHKHAKTFDGVAHRWMIASHREAGELVLKLLHWYGNLAKKVASVTPGIYHRRRYHLKLNIQAFACLQNWMRFFGMRKADNILGKRVTDLIRFKEEYHNSPPEIFKRAQAASLELFKKVAATAEQIAPLFEVPLDVDGLRVGSTSCPTA